MATAVLDLDIDGLPSNVTVPGKYRQALVVVRRRRRPVAQVSVPVHNGSLDMEACQRAVAEATAPRRWHWAVDDYLGSPPAAATLPAATVAICTRERPDDLTRALSAVTALRPAPLEILIVDNNPSTERTRHIAARFAGVRYIREDAPGLDAARNRALRDATAPIVAFTDDDAAPEPEWLEHLLRPFEDPRVLCACGLTLPLELETAAQEWFERYSPFGRGFDRKVFDGIHHDPLAVARIGAGANMALRRSVLADVGPFDEALDAGTAAQSGGDHEMFGRILAAGYRIVYEPRAVSRHRHRRTWEELQSTLHGYGVGVYAVWTRRLWYEREPGVLRHASRWLTGSQLPHLWRAIRRRPGAVPIDLLLAELRGCLAGPAAYIRARRQVRAMERG